MLAAYSLGYIKALADDATSALSLFLEVKNTRLKYLKNSIGICYSDLKDYDKAKYYLRREIELDGHVDEALFHYAEIQYAILAIKFGVELADTKLDYLMIFTYLYIGVLSVCLKCFKLKPGDWKCLTLH